MSSRMPRARSCKESDVQLRIDFPRKKSSETVYTKKYSLRNTDKSSVNHCLVKLKMLPVEIFGEDQDSDDDPFTSPKKGSGLRRDNKGSDHQLVNLVKRKLTRGYESDEENCGPSKSPFAGTSPCKSPFTDRTNFPDITRDRHIKLATRQLSLDSMSDEENCSPSKSQVQVIACKSPLANRNCIAKNKQDPNVLKIPKRKLSLDSEPESSYTKLCQVLHNSIPRQLISREKELIELKRFIESYVVHSKPGSLYICGAPGTGKTACLTKTLEDYEGSKNLKIIFLNCMSLRQSQAIFSRVASLFDSTGKKYSNKESLKYLESEVIRKGPRVLLVLDEIDQLESKNQDVLYKLFELPFLPKSRLALIGIANSLDLTDRILPRLQVKVSCKPILIQFEPYKKDELYAILQSRTKDANLIIDESAIQFCARKVSAMNGDARKAIDLLRRAVEVAEEQSKNKPQLQKKVSICHVATVCSEVYGSRLSSSGGVDVVFPLQQKIIICTMLACLKDSKVKEIVLSKLYESYCRVCKHRHITPAVHEEFIGICNLLESQGIVFVKRVKGVMKLYLRMQEQELEYALQDKILMSSILANGIPS